MGYMETWIANQPKWSFQVYAHSFALLLFVTIVYLAITLVFNWKKSRCFLAWGLTCYLVMVFVFTVFARGTTESYQYELELFWTYKRGIAANGGVMVCEIILNTLMLLPMGVVVPVFMVSRFRRCFSCGLATVFLGFFVSTVIEILQLVLRRGFFEFDDIFHNTLGVLIGFFLYCGVVKVKEILHCKEAAHIEKKNDK